MPVFLPQSKFEVQANPLNLDPINDALRDYGRGIELAYQGETNRQVGQQLAAKNYEGAFNTAATRGQPELAYKMQTFQDEREKANAEREARMYQQFAKIGELAKVETDPAKKMAMINQALDSDPRFRQAWNNHPGDFKNDPDKIIQFWQSQAAPYQTAEQKQAAAAKLAVDLSEARKNNAMADAAGLKDDTVILPENAKLVKKSTKEVIAEGNQSQDATTKKAIDEADDFIVQTKGALGSIKLARQLNEKAYDGWGAGGRAALMNNTLQTEASRATVNLENVVQNQALQSLRSTFGGNPTEGERKILIEVQGSASQPRAVREDIYKRAAEMAEKRLRFNTQKAEALRAGNYYKTGGQPNMNFETFEGGQAGGPIEKARKAIAEGASRDLVIERLRSRGIDPTGL